MRGLTHQCVHSKMGVSDLILTRAIAGPKAKNKCPPPTRQHHMPHQSEDNHCPEQDTPNYFRVRRRVTWADLGLNGESNSGTNWRCGVKMVCIPQFNISCSVCGAGVYFTPFPITQAQWPKSGETTGETGILPSKGRP